MSVFDLNRVTSRFFSGESRNIPGVRGIIASEKIESGEIVIRIAKTDMMNKANVFEEDSDLMYLHDNKSLSSNAILALALMNESKKTSSKWAMYIHSLPLPSDMSSHALTHSSEAMRAFVHSPIMCRSIHPNYPTYVETFNHECAELLKNKSIMMKVGNLTPLQFKESFKYYRLLSGSRSFSTPFGASLVPIADLLNHSDTKNINWYFNETEQTFDMCANRVIFEGEELTDSYGKNLSNNRRFVHYMHSIPDNKFDSVNLKINNTVHLFFYGDTLPDDGDVKRIEKITALQKRLKYPTTPALEKHRDNILKNAIRILYSLK